MPADALRQAARDLIPRAGDFDYVVGDHLHHPHGNTAKTTARWRPRKPKEVEQ
jgi:hypothetical protein